MQLRGHRQIAEPRKYYLVRVIVFLWRVISLFFLFLTGWEFGLIPFMLILRALIFMVLILLGRLVYL